MEKYNCSTKPYSNPRKLITQTTACISISAPAAPSASRPFGPSYAPAKPPPTNVSRNGSAHSHGLPGAPVITNIPTTTVQSAGAMLPKYQDLRSPKNSTPAATEATVIPALPSALKKRLAGSSDTHSNPAAERNT